MWNMKEKPDTQKKREEAEFQERQKKAEADLAALQKEDDEQRAAAKSFVSPVRIEQGKAGSFLCCGRVEVPCEFIESIRVTEPGAAPLMHYSPGFYGVSRGYNYPIKRTAIIIVRMLSGGEHQIFCNRWDVDLLYKSLIDAWKEHR